MQLTKNISVDISDDYPSTVNILNHELNTESLILRVAIFDNGEAIGLDASDEVKAAIAIDGFLITSELEGDKVLPNIVTLDISNKSDEASMLIPGKMFIDIRIESTNGQVFVLPRFKAVVSENIGTHSQVTPQSFGTVEEICQEVAAARGTYESLPQRLTADEVDILGKLNFVGTATSFNDCTQPNTLYNVVADNKNYLVGVFNPNAQWRFEGSEGIKTRVKINGTWRDWVWVAKVGITDEVITARGVYANLNERFQAIEENEAEIINIGTVAQLSDLDSAAYCSENAEFVFAAGNDLKTSLGIAQANNAACSLKYNKGVQVLKAYSDGTAHSEVTISRKINSIAPTFSADIWSGTKIDGSKAIASGTIPFNALNTALKNRITALETAVPEKADYFTVNAIFDANDKLLDVSKDVTHPALSSDATSLYLDKNVTTISKSTLVAYYPNLTTVYVDNDETDVTITGTGELTFVFKGNFNAGQLLYVGISKAINDTNSRLTTLENTVGTVNTILQGIVDGGAANA